MVSDSRYCASCRGTMQPVMCPLLQGSGIWEVPGREALPRPFSPEVALPCFSRSACYFRVPGDIAGRRYRRRAWQRRAPLPRPTGGRVGRRYILSRSGAARCGESRSYPSGTARLPPACRARWSPSAAATAITAIGPALGPLIRNGRQRSVVSSVRRERYGPMRATDDTEHAWQEVARIDPNATSRDG